MARAAAAALDGERDTDLWLWLLSAAVSVAVGLRFFGHYYLQLVPPLRAARGRRAVARQPRAVDRARSAAVGRGRGVVFSAAGYFMPPGRAGAELRVGQSRTSRRTTQPRRPDLRVGQRARDLLGVGPSSRRRASSRRRSSPATTRAGPPDEANTGDDTEAAWDDFYEDFTAHPPKYFVDTSPAKVRGAQYYPISDFPRLEHIVDTQYRYVVTIDGIDVYKRK